MEARITTHSTWSAVRPLGSWAACRRAGWGSWIGDGSLKVGLPGYVGRHYAVLSRALLDPGDTPAPCPLNPLNPLTLFASSSVHLRGGSRSVHHGGGRSVRRGGGHSMHGGGQGWLNPPNHAGWSSIAGTASWFRSRTLYRTQRPWQKYSQAQFLQKSYFTPLRKSREAGPFW